MSTMQNPPFRTTAQMQAGMFWARRNTRARAAVQALTPWSSGLTITAGEYVQSFGSAYIAITSGTTGSTAPSGTTGNINDGGITWQFVVAQSLPNVLP
jgi:hypothetical protein